ncbi:MAG: Fic family protein [Flavobacteriia bacterium]|jgi:Fic family protein
MTWEPTFLPLTFDVETKAVLKKLAGAHRALAELKGTAQSIPKQDILINTLALQEAKDSSEVENIVTTHDELYKSTLNVNNYFSSETKEVQNYVSALKRGFEIVKTKKVLTINGILEIQEVLEKNNAGLRKIPGTNLKNQATGEVIFTPPQDKRVIEDLMLNLEKFINDSELTDLDPIVKMAIIHFQFESIHPFYDGNGRTGRIINILFLVLNELLELPILYLSRYIIRHKQDYYRLLQEIRTTNNWEEWIVFMINAVEKTANETIQLIAEIKEVMQKYKIQLRANYKFYSQELLNHLFKQPYTKIEFLMQNLGISRITASNYLNQLAKDGLLKKQKNGNTNYYINVELMNTLTK